MIWTSPTLILLIAILAWFSDVIIGDPPVVYRRIPHPVCLFGWVINLLDNFINYTKKLPVFQRIWGVTHLSLLIIIFGSTAWLFQEYMLQFSWGWIILGVFAGVFLAQNSLYHHVKIVEHHLKLQDIEKARNAVGKIVGRDTKDLQETEISRAALESLSESYNDGVVAPFFWLVIAGLPGIIIYKLINTADSMIGHRTSRYLYYGWAAARTDDVLNLIPARLAGFLIVLSGLLIYGIKSAQRGLKSMWHDARLHASPNAGWPEAAMAGLLNIRLGGPRYYDGNYSDNPWFHETGQDANLTHLKQGINLYIVSCLLMLLFMMVPPISLMIIGFE